VQVHVDRRNTVYEAERFKDIFCTASQFLGRKDCVRKLSN